jgi:crotonobetainyl-CoA:carnitine CoA-transferase CaiB-like acyl-CoA transferase
VEDPDLGKVRVPHPTPRLSRTPGEVRWVARALGADNDTVYADWIGLRAEELQQLREAKIV